MSTSERIRFKQTGGFGGLTLVAEVDPATLPPEEAASLERLVDDALTEDGPPTGNDQVRDGQQYEIAVTRHGDTKTLRAADPAIPPRLAALVAKLQERAEPVRRD